MNVNLQINPFGTLIVIAYSCLWKFMFRNCDPTFSFENIQFYRYLRLCMNAREAD